MRADANVGSQAYLELFPLSFSYISDNRWIYTTKAPTNLEINCKGSKHPKVQTLHKTGNENLYIVKERKSKPIKNFTGIITLKAGCVAQTHSTRIESNRYLERMDKPLSVKANSRVLQAAQNAIERKMKSRNHTAIIKMENSETEDYLHSGADTGYISGYGIPGEKMTLPEGSGSESGNTMWKILTMIGVVMGSLSVVSGIIMIVHKCYKKFSAKI